MTKSAALRGEIGILVLLSIIWGSSFAWTRVAVVTVPPLTITAVRVSFAALLLLGLMKAKGLSFPKGLWGAFFLQGLLQSAVPFALLGWGAIHLPSGLTGVLNATPPLFVLIINAVGQPGQISSAKVFGVLLGLCGVILVLGVEALGAIGSEPLAEAAVLGASLCYALASLHGRYFTELPALVTATGAMAMAALVMVPTAMIVDQPWLLSPSSASLGAVAVLACLCTGLAMTLYFRLIRTLGPLTTSSGGYLRAGFAVLFGIIFMGERFGAATLVGMLAIVLGLIGVTRPTNS